MISHIPYQNQSRFISICYVMKIDSSKCRFVAKQTKLIDTDEDCYFSHDLTMKLKVRWELIEVIIILFALTLQNLPDAIAEKCNPNPLYFKSKNFTTFMHMAIEVISSKWNKYTPTHADLVQGIQFWCIEP